MKKLFLLSVIGLMTLSGCVKGFQGPEDIPPVDTGTSQEDINANVSKVFGTTFSPDQDWNSTTKHTITVVADAPLYDITKVQILTEAPYFNENARVLNEAATSKGQSVSLTFDCPAEYTELVAACVDSKGVYYIAKFTAGDTKVNFQQTTATTRATYPGLPELPTPDGLVMKYKNSHLSFNAIRTLNATENEKLASWQNSNWENERIWLLTNSGGNSTWKVEKQAVYRTVSITDKEKENLEAILDAVGGKEGRNQTYKDANLNTIRNSAVYQLTRNYLVADGQAPITVAPVQILTTDYPHINLYYYYFNPADLDNFTTEEQKLTYLKNLPKFKCVDGKLTKQASGTIGGDKNGNYFKVHEYVLPYFGDVTSSTTTDVHAKSFIIPAGYYVGFMLRKSKSNYLDSYTSDNEIYKNGTNYTKGSYNGTEDGEIYADGKLNQQINQYPMFSKAVTEKGMHLDDPRAAIFGANQKAYLMFEEGCDVNYVDMIVEVQGGLKEVDAAQEINNNVYTFCFEDRDLGDYDMNDVVIKAERLNISQVKYTLTACGAHDELYLRNINGNVLNNNTEIHSIFGATSLSTFINTQTKNFEPISEIITVEPSFSFTDFSQQVYIYNKTKNSDVKMAQKGEDPHGIMIPCDFAYPKERVCIKDAYLEFNSWGKNPVTSTDWYLRPVEENVINVFNK